MRLPVKSMPIIRVRLKRILRPVRLSLYTFALTNNEKSDENKS